MMNIVLKLLGINGVLTIEIMNCLLFRDLLNNISSDFLLKIPKYIENLRTKIKDAVGNASPGMNPKT